MVNEPFLGLTGVKVLLDFCDLDIAGNADEPSDFSATAQVINRLSGLALSDAGCFKTWQYVFSQHTLQFWLQQGVAGFVICDTDAAYSEKVKCSSKNNIFPASSFSTNSLHIKYLTFQTLLEWRGLFKEFNAPEEERY